MARCRVLLLLLLPRRKSWDEARDGDEEEAESGGDGLGACACHFHEGSKDRVEKGITAYHTETDLSSSTLHVAHLYP